MNFNNIMKFGFIYSKSSPNEDEIKYLQKALNSCDVIMGDLNLSHRKKEDQQKLDILCGKEKRNMLNEITRSISNNQLDYVLVNKELTEFTFSTS